MISKCNIYRSISFPETALPLFSGKENEDLWDKAFRYDRILVSGFTAHVSVLVRMRTNHGALF